MPTVRCRRRDCVSWDRGACLRDLITIDEEEGCINFQEFEELLQDDDDITWDDDDVDEEALDLYDDEEDEWEEEADDDEEAAFGVLGLHDDI
jgi:hypothetical protein